MRAFIVRPFGTKDGINFDEIQKKLIDPAMDKAQIAGDTTASIVEAGNIRVDMFQLLLLADLVIADISVHNANVFYELGIRHALRSRQTVLIRAKSTKPREQRGPQDEVPFDLRTDRYLEYDSQKPDDSVDALVGALTATGLSERTDSPVFQSLPALEEQDRSRMTPVPRSFKEEVDKVFALRETGTLALLGAETHGFVWEVEGLRLTVRALYRLSANAASEAALEKIRKIYPTDLPANLLLGTVFQRLGKLADSEAALKRVLENPGISRSYLAEAFSLLGRNDKARLTKDWLALEIPARREQTLRSRYFLSCYENYRQAFLNDLNHFYSGLNALAWVTIALELVHSLPQVWNQAFESDDEAQAQEKSLLAQRAQLVESVGLSLESNAASNAQQGAPPDIWLTISQADYKFLTSKRSQVAATAYSRAMESASIFEADSARAMLEIYKSLDLFPDRVADCLAVFPAPPEKKKTTEVGTVIIFTGHMIDAPERPKPRFPAACEEKAREAIRAALKPLAGDPETTLGLAGGACGGDILFHEECSKLSVRTRLRLTLPPGPFLARSVAHAGENWIRRFHDLTASLKDETQVLAASEELPDWLKTLANYDVFQRTNIWLLEEALSLGAREVALIALWDGKPGDGPGGTQHLVESAKSRGVNVIRLDTKNLFSDCKPV
jgi:hypothetical protein